MESHILIGYGSHKFMCNRVGTGFVKVNGLWVMLCVECMILHKDNSNLLKFKDDLKKPYECECQHGFTITHDFKVLSS